MDIRDIEIKVPEGAAFIIDTLEAAGYEAYIVGGCVRDSIISAMTGKVRVPGDWDITTSARPGEVQRLFRRTIGTGLQHGTVTVMLRGEGYEVTTYRTDADYSDHRHPDNVTFSSSLEEDLKRRDFTINAMAYNKRTGLKDMFGGLSDLEAGMIRCVGDPLMRLKEDALRMLRAVRFSAQLGFDIDSRTREAISLMAGDISYVSAERIETELTKLLISDHPEKLIDAYRLGLTAAFLPEFGAMMETEQNTPYHIYNVGEHTISVIKGVRPEKHMRYAALLHDVGKPMCKTTEVKEVSANGRVYHTVDHFFGHADAGADMVPDIMNRLRMDNATKDKVKRLVRFHDHGIGGNITKRSMRRLLSKCGPENFSDLAELRYADIMGQSTYARQSSLENLERMKKLYDEIMADGEALSIKDLAIDGHDLMELGVPAGPEIGRVLKALLDRVLDDPQMNERDKLIKLSAEV